MRSGSLDIFFDARNSLFGYVTNTNIPNYASMQCYSVHESCKYIIAFKIRLRCQLSSNYNTWAGNDQYSLQSGFKPDIEITFLSITEIAGMTYGLTILNEWSW